MPKHDVHLYVVVRVKRTGIDADTMEEAIAIAEELTDLDSLLESHTNGDLSFSYAEEVVSALVDVVGDEEYLQTRSFEPVHTGWAERSVTMTPLAVPEGRQPIPRVEEEP